jgi:U4/U6.U5 tri-snRNP-associated protein 2
MDPFEFIQFLLNEIHKGSKIGSRSSSVIDDVFRGEVEVTTSKIGAKNEGNSLEYGFSCLTDALHQKNTFLTLLLEIPPQPLFKDESEKNIIPQRPIFDLLAKFDSYTQTVSFSHEI